MFSSSFFSFFLCKFVFSSCSCYFDSFNSNHKLCFLTIVTSSSKMVGFFNFFFFSSLGRCFMCIMIHAIILILNFEECFQDFISTSHCFFFSLLSSFIYFMALEHRYYYSVVTLFIKLGTIMILNQYTFYFIICIFVHFNYFL